MANSLFASLNVDMVLQGCDITDNGNGTINIAQGIIYVSGEISRFTGANNVLSDNTKTFVRSAPVYTGSKFFGNGQPQDVYSEVQLIIGDKTNGSQVPIGVSKLYNLQSYIFDVVASYGIKGEIKDVHDFDGTFLDNFDEDGLGITARYTNWQFLNGRNGAPDGQGRSRITVGTMTDTDNVEHTYQPGVPYGAVRHKLTVAELPKFTPKIKHGLAQRGNTGTAFVMTYDGTLNEKNLMEIGGDQAHNILSPVIAVYTIIKIA